MKHRVSLRRLRRTSEHRWALLRTMVSQLIQHGRIETTIHKAKELRRVADRCVSWGKERLDELLSIHQGTLAARRQAAAIVRGDDILKTLFGDLAQRYREREGGYTRVLRTRRRPNDGAQMAFIEYVDREGELRPARPPKGPSSLLPLAAQVVANDSRQD